MSRELYSNYLLWPLEHRLVE